MRITILVLLLIYPPLSPLWAFLLVASYAVCGAAANLVTSRNTYKP